MRATTTTVGRGSQDMDVPQSVTIMTEKLLDDRRADTVREALHYAGGITFQAAEGGEEDIRLRGFSLTASGDIYIDTVRDPAFYDRDVFNFDRVEVLRGSASMLFGRGSTGGVVNQVSKQPSSRTSTKSDRHGGTGNYFRATGDFNLQTSATSAVRLDVMGTTPRTTATRSTSTASHRPFAGASAPPTSSRSAISISTTTTASTTACPGCARDSAADRR